jgi:alpha-galactosidase
VTPIQPYAFWSNAAPSFGSGIDIREKTLDYGALRRLFGDWREINRYYYGDFYPLTPYSQDEAAWIGWQFDYPEVGEGLIQAFRRGKSDEDTVHLKLRGLNPKASYAVKVVDAVGSEALSQRSWSGAELMDVGLPVTLKDRPAAAVLTYSRVK